MPDSENRDERYAPPSAVVADIPVDGLELPPPSVTLAVRMLWISLLPALPGTIHSLRHYKAGVELAVGLALTVAIFALCAFLYVHIERGRNWARIVTLLLTLVGLATMFRPEAEEAAALEVACTWIATLLDLAAMALVFLPPGSDWFRRRR